MSTVPVCSAVKRLTGVSGVKRTRSALPRIASATARQKSTLKPRHTPWLSGKEKPAMPTFTPQVSVPRARMAAEGELLLRQDDDPEHAGATLLAVKGIGPWTVNYTLLRGYGYADCSLHGDVAVRSAIGRLTGASAKPDIAQAETWLAAYRPHRTMAAAYLWASLNQPAG